nr:F-box only protein 27-like [Vicugna pacos]
MMVQDLGDLAMEESWEVMPRAPLRVCFRSPYRWYHKKKQVLDLEEEGFWPELLDSGKIEICFSDWWTAQQDINSIYRLTIQLLDANQAILDQFSTTLFPIRNRRHTSFLERLYRCLLGSLLLLSDCSLVPMAERIPSSSGGGLNLLRFQDWDQDSQLKVNYLKTSLEFDVSAYSVKNEVVP